MDPRAPTEVRRLRQSVLLCGRAGKRMVAGVVIDPVVMNVCRSLRDRGISGSGANVPGYE
jgi:hypothetical protein